ncbi:MAG TPA: zf-HC2 domain-containing protein [Planctomycetota bacterium]|jgi:hypothetical protein|nr:zf-HC2 domain-containing protein [Planctomycetota bacterium]
MGDSRRPEEDPVLAFLVGRFGPEDSGAGGEPCPGENLLAGLADGALLPEERERLERHLGGCEACASVAAALGRAGLAGEGRTERPRALLHPGAGRGGGAEGARRFLRPLLAAAALLIGVLGIAFGPPLLRALGRSADTDALLVASAQSLSRARPDLFGGFSPVPRAERVAPPPLYRGGDLLLVYPAGRIREVRPSFRWEPDGDAKDYEVVVRTEEGAVVWRARTPTPSLAYPGGERDLDAGVRYVWEVSANGPREQRSSRRDFEVASPSERARLESGVSLIREHAPERVRDLLAAHFALRRGFYGDAEEAARAYFGRRPEDPVGRETLLHVLRRLGSSEADRLGSSAEARGGGR